MTRYITALIAVVLGTVSTYAQTTGMVQGTVADADGGSVAGALVILLPMREGREAVELETGADGRFARSDIPSGFYTITAALGDQRSDVYRVQVRDRRTAEVRFILEAGRTSAPRLAGGDQSELDSLFEAGVAANREGAFAEAITYFSLGVQLFPAALSATTTPASRMVRSSSGRRRSARSTTPSPCSLTTPPRTTACRTSTRGGGRPDDAAAAREAATELTLSVLAMNRQRAVDAVDLGLASRDTGNLEDARTRFEEATTYDMTHAPAYYWLGVTFVELNDPTAATAAFYRYLSLDGNGEHAADARARLAVLDPPR